MRRRKVRRSSETQPSPRYRPQEMGVGARVQTIDGRRTASGAARAPPGNTPGTPAPDGVARESQSSGDALGRMPGGCQVERGAYFLGAGARMHVRIGVG